MDQGSKNGRNEKILNVKSILFVCAINDAIMSQMSKIDQVRESIFSSIVK